MSDRRLRLALLGVAQIALVAAAVVLAWTGFEAVANTTSGSRVDPVLDPTAAGFEAFVEPTATFALLGSDADGGLDWAVVLVLSGADRSGGTVVTVPVTTVVTVERRERTLVEVDAAGGAEGVRSALADLLVAGIDDVAAIGPAELAVLVEGAGTIALDNPDGVPAFPAGPLSLEPGAAADFLAATEPGESELTRLSRHEAFWLAWLDAIGSSQDPDVVPGESSSGIGRFLRGVAAGPHAVAVPPVDPVTGRDGEVGYELAADAALAFTAAHVPFPSSPRPGVRSQVRVLDGVGADGMAASAARDAVGAGGQVAVIGNADRFDPTRQTRVTYLDARFAEAASALAEAFGVEAEQLHGVDLDDGVDVTVVAGADLLAAYGLEPRAVPSDGDRDG